MIDAIEGWRGKQKPMPNVSEAIRRLVDLGLKAKATEPQPQPAPSSAKRRGKSDG
jgi:hypothetical protein